MANTPNLDHLKKLYEQKDVEQFAKIMMSMIAANGLTLDEVAAINYYTMKTALESKQNKEFMEEHFKIDVEKLGPEGIFKVQQALLSTYYKKIK